MKTRSIVKRPVAIVLAVMLILSMIAVAFGVSSISADSAELSGTVSVGTKGQSDKAFWVDATYFDYLSDKEMTDGWLNPLQAGTGFNGSMDNWYPFDSFNQTVKGTTAQYPLYFGNFCFTPGAYNMSDHNGNFFTQVGKVSDFSYIANDSNALKDYHYSVRGLASDTLGASGKIAYPNGKTMPTFDSSKISEKAQIFKSFFPFRQTKIGDVNKYTFDSEGAKDNVFFTWKNGNPDKVHYGQGTTYGVRDGIQYFMNPDDINPETGQKYASGYGIFPFNNTESEAAGNPGNGNLDYGFGIKMNFDFKVPEGGVLPNGEDVMFDYTGDDDLWVYIAEYDAEGNLGEGKLVLDLGGNHKQTSGNINFRTMTSTANNSSVISHEADPNCLYIHDDREWQGGKWKIGADPDREMELRVWAWADGATGEMFTPTFDEETMCYKLSKSATGHKGGKLSNYTDFLVTGSFKGTNEVNPESQDDQKYKVKTHDLKLSTYYGKILYTSKEDYIPPFEKAVYKDNYTKSFANMFTTASDGKLDTSKRYNMTIFYMERGTIESNCSMGFTMTPSKNDVTVTKKVNTANVNDGLKTVVTNKDKFDFAVTNGTKSVTSKLGNDGSETFSNAFETGDKVSVSETYNSLFDYTTSHSVYNLSTGTAEELDKDVDGKDTSKTKYTLINTKTNNTHDYASLRYDYVNTPVVAPLEVSKEILDKDGNPAGGVIDTFSYTIKLDLGDGYKAYNLKYKNGDKESVANDGKFSFKSSEIVTFEGIPANAKYQIVEDSATGYQAVEATLAGTILATGNKIRFQNKQVPTDTTVEAKKTLDGKAYTGTLFSFTLTGLDKSSGATQSAKGQTQTVNKVSAGKVTFTPDETFLNFPTAGTYRYELKEESLAADSAYKSDIKTDKTTYYVNVEVKKDGDKLKATTSYFSDKEFTKALDSAPTFKNDVVKGSMTITKTAQDNSPLENTEFKVYKTTAKDADLGDVVATKKTDKNGVAKFEDLDIYEAGYENSSAPKYQWYCIVETNSETGYSLNLSKYYFVIPTEGKYDLKCDYMNGRIFNPDTAGNAFDAIKYVGLGVIILSLVLGGLYLYNTKRYKCKRFAE